MQAPNARRSNPLESSWKDSFRSQSGHTSIGEMLTLLRKNCFCLHVCWQASISGSYSIQFQPYCRHASTKIYTTTSGFLSCKFSCNSSPFSLFFSFSMYRCTSYCAFGETRHSSNPFRKNASSSFLPMNTSLLMRFSSGPQFLSGAPSSRECTPCG